MYIIYAIRIRSWTMIVLVFLPFVFWLVFFLFVHYKICLFLVQIDPSHHGPSMCTLSTGWPGKHGRGFMAVTCPVMLLIIWQVIFYRVPEKNGHVSLVTLHVNRYICKSRISLTKSFLIFINGLICQVFGKKNLGNAVILEISWRY